MELEDSTPRTTLKSSSRKRDRSLPARPAGDPLAPTERRRRPIWPRVNSVDSRPQFPKDPGHGGCAATVARPPPTAKEWKPQWAAWPKKRRPLALECISCHSDLFGHSPPFGKPQNSFFGQRDLFQAVVITASWGDYVALPRAHRVLHYWWVPDSTFIDAWI